MEAMAWELYDRGVTYADIASYALNHDLTFEDALVEIWMNHNE